MGTLLQRARGGLAAPGTSGRLGQRGPGAVFTRLSAWSTLFVGALQLRNPVGNVGLCSTDTLYHPMTIWAGALLLRMVLVQPVLACGSAHRPCLEARFLQGPIEMALADPEGRHGDQRW